MSWEDALATRIAALKAEDYGRYYAESRAADVVVSLPHVDWVTCRLAISRCNATPIAGKDSGAVLCKSACYSSDMLAVEFAVMESGRWNDALPDDAPVYAEAEFRGLLV